MHSSSRHLNKYHFEFETHFIQRNQAIDPVPGYGSNESLVRK